MALIDDIEQQRILSVLWHLFGWYLKFYLGKTDFSWYFPISLLFWMGCHWYHWTAKSLLSPLSVLIGGSIISFTQVNLNSKEFALSSVSFNLGGQSSVLPRWIWKFELVSSFALIHRALYSYIRNERPINKLGLVKNWMFSNLCPWRHHTCVLNPSKQGSFFRDNQFEGSHA